MSTSAYRSYLDQILGHLAAEGLDFDLDASANRGPTCRTCLMWEPKTGTCGQRRAEGFVVHTAASAAACAEYMSGTLGVR